MSCFRQFPSLKRVRGLANSFTPLMTASVANPRSFAFYFIAILNKCLNISILINRCLKNCGIFSAMRKTCYNSRIYSYEKYFKNLEIAAQFNVVFLYTTYTLL